MEEHYTHVDPAKKYSYHNDSVLISSTTIFVKLYSAGFKNENCFIACTSVNTGHYSISDQEVL